MTAAFALLAFAAGVLLVIAATEWLLHGLVGIAAAARVAPFVASVILSGMEVENIAVGLAAGQRGSSDVALGTAFGGAIFLLTMALGVGALIAPLRVDLPRSIVLLIPASALLAGLPVLFGETPRWTGLVLLGAFGLAIVHIVRTSRGHDFVDDAPLRAANERPRPLWRAIALTFAGIAVVAAGGELVAVGADGLITAFGLTAGLVGMIVTPAAIEAEEIIRQALPARRGYADVSAGNAVGTVLYFLLFNLGLVALLTPVLVPDQVRWLDWPALLIASAVAASMLLRGRVGRAEGIILTASGVVYAVIHVFVG